MKILVTGGCGQLGMCLRGILPPGTLFADVLEAPHTLQLDITNLQAVREVVAREGVDCIVNCAAYTNVEAAEDQPELAELLNATAVGYLATTMQEAGGLLLHISTDYVFGKEPYNQPCREEQQGTPTGVYGLTKLHGEQAVIQSGVRHVIIRTSWLYSEYGKNFVKTMLRLTAEKPTLNVVFDQVGTPTYAGDLARAIGAILALDAPEEGIYHFSNEGVCSWYDFACAIAELSGNTSCDIQPCHSEEFPSRVSRPAYSVLDKSKIKEVFGLRIPYWRDSLRMCLGRLES